MRNFISHLGSAFLWIVFMGVQHQAHGQLTLSSTITYSGRQTGQVWAAASLDRSILITPTRLGASLTQGFTNSPLVLSNLFAGGSYYIFAWRDSNGNGAPDATEAQAWNPAGAFLVTSNRAVSGFVIDDPDQDQDQLPDWWEEYYGLPKQPGSGCSGPLTLAAGEIAFTDTLWASVEGVNPAGSALLNISTNRGFTTNDLVLIINMQDPNANWALNQAGMFELGRIASASSNSLTLAKPRANAYTVGTTEKIQVIKVPEYTEVNLASNWALQFDGSSGYATVNNLDLRNMPLTIEMWAKRESIDTWDGLVGQGSASSGNGLFFGFRDANDMVFSFYAGGLYTTNAYTDTAWHHWAAIYDPASGRRILRDGVVIAEDSNKAGYSGTGPLHVGTLAWMQSQYCFGGQIDEVRIWNVARSAADIEAGMNGVLSGTEPGLLAYYRLDEGMGSGVLDSTGHGYNGVLQGSRTWVPGPLSVSTILTCQPWNGTHGGVLAFLAHQVTMGDNSMISADGKGYRGGDGVPSQSDYQYGLAGERTTGASTAREANSLERAQGGGGAGKGADGSGGGGGYGGPGANGAKTLAGSDYGRGATTLFGSPDLARLYPGGGGGGSGSHSAGRIGVGGGAGGGVVLIAAGSIEGSGTISSRGGAGQAGVYISNSSSGSGGGGGAGGSVYLVGNVAGSIEVRATGGAGGVRDASASSSKDGGLGGVGRIRLDLPADVSVPVTTLPEAGYTNQSLAGLSQILPNGGAYDSDYDGVSDLEEYQRDTNPKNADTDGDTLPDKWELEYGLNPLFAGDAAIGQDSDNDGVENTLEFYRGTRPDLWDTDGDGLSDSEELFVYRTDPLKTDTDGDGMGDRDELFVYHTDPLFRGTQYFYDSLDRLVGAQYETGLGLGYEYDRNNNLLRQVYTYGDANDNALPDVWEFLHGLTNNTSGFVDTDGDGWSDWQELQAGTDPRDPNSKPDLVGSPGIDVASLVLPFTPSNFVLGVGQLDGLGAEEIVLGADGHPGSTTNFLLVLSQTLSGWSTQRVDVGPFGVTSIAVGQPANRPSPAIYVGLRQPSGTGRVVEFTPAGGGWISNTLVAVSTDEEACVLGVRPGKDLIVSLAQTSAPPGCAYYASYSSGWTNVLANTNASRRGLGIVTEGGPQWLKSRGVRLLNSGNIEVLGHDIPVQADAIWNEDYSRWFFSTTSTFSWAAAQNYARTTYGGNLATVTDATLDAWLWSHFGGSGVNIWIGLSRENTSAPWQWASGLPLTYANWAPGEPTTDGVGAHLWSSYAGRWNDAAGPFRGIVEVTAVEDQSMTGSEPESAGRLLWRGHSLSSGDLRLGEALSLLYSFVEDKNLNAKVDGGDEFVVAEYLYSGSTLALNSLQRIPLADSMLAPCYGLASIDVLYGQKQVLFTAEPDGRLYDWSATNGSPSLKRQLFSAQYTGKAWHALSGARTLDAGQSLVGLCVDPATPDRCDLILWPPQQQLPALADLPQTAPVAQILPSPHWGRDIAQVNVRVWDAEGSPSLPELMYQLPATTLWTSATVAAVNGGAPGLVATEPSGLTHQVIWDAARDLGAGFTNTVSLRARAKDLALTGAWSPPVAYVVHNSLANNPRAYADFATTAQGLPVDIDVLANDTVENQAPRLIASVGAPAHGTAVTNSNKTLRYSPAPAFFGTDQFTYTLTDGAGGYSIATVTVNVTPGSPVVIQLTAPTLQNGSQFSMMIWGTPGHVYQVQASTNLTSWADVRTITNLTGTVPFTEQVSTNAPVRFYRALLRP